MTEKNSNIPTHPGITPCEDGKLRWSYTLNLWRQPVMLYTASGTMSAAVASFGLLVCFVRMGMDGFSAGIAYIFSMVTAIAGLAFAGRLHRHRWCRMLAYIQLAAGVLLFVPLRSYAALTLPPLFLHTVLYLFGVGWREKRDYEQQ
jgi:hypothetical protein